MTDLIFNLLKLVPEPHVQLAATAARAIIDAVRKDPSMTDADVEAAFQKALEPWLRIKHIGEEQISSSKVDIGSDVPNGGAN